MNDEDDEVQDETEDDEVQDETEDEGEPDPLHVPVKEAHADELQDLLSRYGYAELANAFGTAEIGQSITVTIVED